MTKVFVYNLSPTELVKLSKFSITHPKCTTFKLKINLWDKCREINNFPFEVLVAWRQKITLLGGSVAWEGKLKPAQLQLKLSRSFRWPWRQLAIQLALLFLLKLEFLILQSHTSWIGTDWLRLWIINISLCLRVGQKMSVNDIYL